jgi:hypothetical protein
MPARYTLGSSLRFLLGILLLLGTLLVSGLFLLANFYLPVLLIAYRSYPFLLLLLLLPATGVLLGIRLIMSSNEPLWSKLLALFSPVLGPVLLFLLSVF